MKYMGMAKSKASRDPEDEATIFRQSGLLQNTSFLCGQRKKQSHFEPKCYTSKSTTTAHCRKLAHILAQWQRTIRKFLELFQDQLRDKITIVIIGK
jgi:hypothetical protein